MVDVVHLIKVVYLMVMVHLVDVIHLVVVAHLIEVTTWLTWYTWLTWWFTQLTWCTWLSWCSFYPSEIVVIVWSESFRVIQVSSRCSCNPSDLTVLVRSEWDRGDRVIPRVRSEWSRVDDRTIKRCSYDSSEVVVFVWSEWVRIDREILVNSWCSCDPIEFVMFMYVIVGTSHTGVSQWYSFIYDPLNTNHRCVTMIQVFFCLWRMCYNSCRVTQFGIRTVRVVTSNLVIVHFVSFHTFFCVSSHTVVSLWLWFKFNS